MMKSIQQALMILLALAVSAITATASAEVTYFHHDALGSVVAATDESGAVLWRESYQPYGERLEKTVSTDQNAFYYTGKPHDDRTGLTYFGARHYDPVIGRFMGIDPVGVDPGNPHSFNRYAYANNNPYRYVDLDGNEPVFLGAFRRGQTMAQTLEYSASTRFNMAATATAVGALAATEYSILLTTPIGKEVAKEVVSEVTGIPIVPKGPLKNASGNLDDAASAARTQRHGTPNLTQHARERMAGSRGDGQTVSVDRVQEAIDQGRITSTNGPKVNRRINASDSASGRGLQVTQDVRTNNVITVIDKGSKR